MCIRDRPNYPVYLLCGLLIWNYITQTTQYAMVSMTQGGGCLLYTSDAADERSSVDLGGRRIIKKKQTNTLYIALY